MPKVRGDQRLLVLGQGRLPSWLSVCELVIREAQNPQEDCCAQLRQEWGSADPLQDSPPPQPSVGSTTSTAWSPLCAREQPPVLGPGVARPAAGKGGGDSLGKSKV